MPIEGLSAIAQEIEKVIERNLRIEILKARAAQLEQEIAEIRRQLSGATGKSGVQRFSVAPKPVRRVVGAVAVVSPPRQSHPRYHPKNQEPRTKNQAVRPRRVAAAAPRSFGSPALRHTRVVEVKKAGVTLRQRAGYKSVRTMMVEAMSKERRPMTIAELTRILLRKGFKSTRKEPYKTVDVTLRSNPALFRKIAPGAFELIRR
jgi:hypothetical protein